MLEKLSYLENQAQKRVIPILSKEKAAWLEEFILANDFKLILELGTAIGYSTLLLAQTGAAVTTIDRDLRILKEAREFVAYYGGNVSFIEGDGLDELYKLKGPWDLVFIDFEKKKYLDAFKYVQDKAKYVILDNISNPKCADCFEYVKTLTCEFVFEDLVLIRLK